MSENNITRKRSMLLSARIRFSPETQPVKETSIDKLIEHNLLVGDCPEGLTLADIESQRAFSFANGAPTISSAEVKKSLDRLIVASRVTFSSLTGQLRYKLSETALTELKVEQLNVENRFLRVVAKLFRNAEGDPSNYTTPFLDCLCIIFAKLGEVYVRFIQGKISNGELLRMPQIIRAIQSTRKKYNIGKDSGFDAGVISFFRDSEPDYDAIKWNMAQNYYIAKALGLDAEGSLLSEEMFGNAVFYLDTNVLIQALEPKTPYHRTFQAFSRACQKLKIKFAVYQGTLDELRYFYGKERDGILKVADQIPDALAPKVNGLYPIYQEALKQNGTVDIDTLFANFVRPMDVLTQSYQVNLVDDPWFGQVAGKKETKDVIKAVGQAYFAKRSIEKKQPSALHDALLLQWIQLEREKNVRNTWLVTLDTSLPSVLLPVGNLASRPLAISLDAILQWISPIAFHEDIEDEVAAIFAEAVKYQVLPQDGFFDIRDFLVFADMEWSCKELPAEDVEACLQYVKTTAPGLDPTNANDRQKIAREITKFFADPGRKYKQEVERLEGEVAQVRNASEQQLLEIRKEVESRDQHIAALEQKELEREARLVALERDRDEKIATLQKEQKDLEERNRQRVLKRSAIARTTVIVVFFLIYESIAIYLSLQYGSGTTWFQQLVNSWVVLAFGPVATPLLIRFVVGRERIRIMGGPATKLLSDEK